MPVESTPTHGRTRARARRLALALALATRVGAAAALAAGCGFNQDATYLRLPAASLDPPPPPVAGGTLLVLHDGRTALAADPDNDAVHLVDLQTRAVLHAALTRGDEPGRAAQDAAGRVHVVLRGAGAVATLDPRTAQWLYRRAVCPAPRGIAYDPALDHVVVACSRGALVDLPAGDGPVASQVQLDEDLRDVIVRADGTRMVSRFRSAEVLVLGPNNAIAARRRPVTVTLTGAGTTLTQRYEPSVAWRMIDSAAGPVLVHQRGLIGPEAVPPARSYSYARSVAPFTDPCENAVTHAALTLFDPHGVARGQSPPIRRGTLPVDVAIAPSGHVAVALAGELEAFYSQGPQVVVAGGTAFTTESPAGCVGATPGQRFPGQVVAVAFDPAERLLVQLREPAALAIDGAVVALADDPRRDTGHDVFHAAAGGIACASCHPEGGDDGRVWNFRATGPLRTQPLQGGVLSAPRLHWGGDEPTFRALVDVTLTERMQGAHLDDPQLGALAHWIDGLAPVPRDAPDAAPDTAAERGAAVFASAAAGCTDCHAGARMTNNAMATVGRGTWRVPSLLGVALRRPYLHDGCAATLADAIQSSTCAPNHGNAPRLTQAQRDDLVAYLQSL